MPIFALYNFDDTGTVVNDSALADGNQYGAYFDGATPIGGEAVLDGINDKVKIYPNPAFEMARGTLDIQFIQASHTGTGVNTILSRDSVGETDSGFRIEALASGALRISHESTTGGTTVYQTAAGFQTPGDEVHITYSWDETSGGRLDIENLSTTDTFTSAVPAGLTMDGGVESQPWIIGAGQSRSDPGVLNNIDTYFRGSASVFSLSDTVDNVTGDDPIASPDTASTDEDTPVVIDVLSNDTDPNGDTLTIVGTPTAGNGTVTVNGDGTLNYTPDPNYNGPDTITYVVRDPSGNTDTSTVTVTVDPVNDAPVAVDDTASTAVGTAVRIDILSNDTDVDGDRLSIVGTPTSPNGTVVVNGDRTITFTPTSGFTGTATISYTVTDPDGLTDTAVVTVGVGGDSPTANPDTATTDEDTPVVIDVLTNDTDPNGDTLTIVGTPTAGNGTVTVNGDGTLNYTPDPDYNGPDTITYTVRDPSGNTDTSTVAVTVDPVNDAPVALDDAATTPTGTPVIIDILANDSDVDGDTLSIVGTPTSPDGTVVVNGDNTITFTPTSGFGGPTTISYTVRDPAGLTDTAVVSVVVGAAPVPDGYVDGSAAGELIDDLYTGDPNGDFVDHSDALLPGAAPEDDVIRAGAGDDTILAGLGDDIVTAGPGNDSVFGGVGDDTLYGGDGNDTIDAGPGADRVEGGGGDDVIISDDPGESLPDRAFPGLNAADADAFDNRDTVYGGSGNDTISTGDDADLVYGGLGDDSIDGGVDADTIVGGDGNDTIVGGEGSDSIQGNLGDDLIYGGLGDGATDPRHIVDGLDPDPGNDRDTIDAGSGNDTVFGLDDADLIYGGAGDDLLDGGIDNDTVVGGFGNDTIIGGLGADSLYGSGDRDTFLVNSLEEGLGDRIDGGEAGDDFDTLDLRGAGPLRVDYSATNPENGTVRFFDGDHNVNAALRVNQHLRPIMIRQGSLGNGLPERDMMVSPNHRVLVANDRTALYFDEHEVLVAAKHLIGGKGIFSLDSIGTCYIHFMFDQHEVVLSDGAWSESFQPGDFTLKGMGNAQRNEIFELFPDLQTDAGLDDYIAARRTLKRHEAVLLTR